jgi:hypothetical protein
MGFAGASELREASWIAAGVGEKLFIESRGKGFSYLTLKFTLK